jgi:hypothetical protein
VLCDSQVQEKGCKGGLECKVYGLKCLGDVVSRDSNRDSNLDSKMKDGWWRRDGWMRCSDISSWSVEQDVRIDRLETSRCVPVYFAVSQTS